MSSKHFSYKTLSCKMKPMGFKVCSPVLRRVGDLVGTELRRLLSPGLRRVVLLCLNSCLAALSPARHAGNKASPSPFGEINFDTLASGVRGNIAASC